MSVPELDAITTLTRDYATRRNVLTARVRELQGRLAGVRDRYIDGIREAVRDVAGARALLHAALDAHPGLFVKPKTLTLHGVRVGYLKQRGQVVIDDEAAVVARIRKRLPKDQAELLIRVRESVHKPGVYDLTATDLKRLGITVTADSEQVCIKPVDGEIDKIVNALLAEAERAEAA